MKNASEHIEWVVLGPATIEQLKSVADKVNPPLKGWGDSFSPQWNYVECSDGYAALLNHKPGTRDSHESDIAKQLSTLLNQTVYVIYTEEPSGVLVYEKGACTRELDDDPYEFAESKGCSLREKSPQKVVTKEIRKAVAVVEGTSAQDVSVALGFDSPPNFPGYDMRIIDGAMGAIVSRDDINDLTMTASELSQALSDKDIYTLTVPAAGRFIAWLVRDGVNVGFFELPVGAGGIEQLDSIKGQTTPEGIAAELGVPLELLGLD